MSDCVCLTPPFLSSDFIFKQIGVDDTNGRYGEVRLDTCRRCGRNWLHYFVEYEAFPNSGRWYRGLVTEDTARRVTPRSAVAILEALDWHFYGGSYFDTIGKRGAGRLFVDL